MLMNTQSHHFLKLCTQEPRGQLGKMLGRVEHAKSFPPVLQLSLALEVHIPSAGMDKPTQQYSTSCGFTDLWLLPEQLHLLSTEGV